MQRVGLFGKTKGPVGDHNLKGKCNCGKQRVQQMWTVGDHNLKDRCNSKYTNENMKKIIKFEAPWCGPCKILTTTFEAVTSELKETLPPFEVEVVDVGEEGDKVDTYAVKNLPTIIVVDESGATIDKKVGLVDRPTLTEWLTNLLA